MPTWSQQIFSQNTAICLWFAIQLPFLLFFLRNSISFGLGGFPSGVRIMFLAATKPVSKTWGALGLGLVTPIWQMGGLQDYCFGRFLSSSLLPPSSARKFHFKLRNRYSTTKYKLGDGFKYFIFSSRKLGNDSRFGSNQPLFWGSYFSNGLKLHHQPEAQSAAAPSQGAWQRPCQPCQVSHQAGEVKRWSWCILYNTH